MQYSRQQKGLESTGKEAADLANTMTAKAMMVKNLKAKKMMKKRNQQRKWKPFWSSSWVSAQ